MPVGAPNGCWYLPRPQKIKQILFLLLGKRLESSDHAIRFGTCAGMFGYRIHEIFRAPVVQEKDALSKAPQGRGSELIRAGAALGDPIRKICAHVMHKQVGKQMRLHLAQIRRHG